MTDIEIIQQLCNGNHLNTEELKRAKIILDYAQIQYDKLKKSR